MIIRNKKQIAYGAIMSYVSIGINIIIGLVFTPWMISSIGKENYGLFTLALSVISLFVFDFGLSSAVTRFISVYMAEGKYEKIPQFLGEIFKMYLVIDIFLFLILCSVYFFIPNIYKELSYEEIEKFKIIYIMAASFSIISLPLIPVNGILTANEKFFQNKLCDVLHKIIVVFAMTLVLLNHGGLYTLVMVNIWSGIIVYVAKIWCIYKYTRTRVDVKYHNFSEMGELLHFSGWITIISICKRMIFTIAPTVLGIFCGSASIAIFGIANAIEGYVFYFADALSGMLLPKVSRVCIQEGGNVLPLMVKIGRIQFFIVSAIVLGFAALGYDFLMLWIGDQFSDAYICVLLLILPCMFQLPQEVGCHALIVQNKVKQEANVFMVMGVVNIVLGFLFTYLFDVFGMCLSICIAYFVRTIGLDVVMYKVLKIDVIRFFRLSFMRQLCPVILSMILSIYINSFIECRNWFAFIMEASVFYILFIISSLLILNNDERKMIKKIALKISKLQ